MHCSPASKESNRHDPAQDREEDDRRTAPKPATTGIDELNFMIDSAWERRTMLTPDEIEGSTRPTVERVIDGLESGEFRVAEPDGKGGWTVNEWLKKAVLLYFRTQEMELVEADPGAVLGQGSGALRRISTNRSSASSARAWCRARSCGAARTSARTSC